MKIRKYVIIILSIMICFVHTISLADINSIRGEGATRPASPPSGDPSTPNVNPQVPQQSGTKVVTTVLHSSISGNAFEDLKQYDENISMYTTNLQKDNNESGIKDIIVQLISGENIVAQTVTDSNGNYSFTPTHYGNAGEYKLRFIYGYVDSNRSYSDYEIKNIIKYNGQDYKSQVTGTNRSKLMTSYEETIIKKQKGCSQIFLLLDSSSSMQETDENGISRLDIEKEAAKQLVNDLLNTNENIYIGIIGFGETAVVRKQLSNNKDKICEAIDNLNNIQEGESYGSGTNISAAVVKAKESFVNKDIDNSNRTVILLSDGAPTIYDGIKIYREDSDQEIIDKCNQIAELTNQKMKEIKAEGVKFMTIIPRTNDEFEDGLINKVLDGDIGTCYKPQNMSEITEIIKNEFVTEIEKSQEESTIWNNGSEFATDDNKERRELVNSYFQQLGYSKVEKFDNITEYDGSNRQEINDFSNNTYMWVETKTYRLDGTVTQSEYYDEETDTLYKTIDQPWTNQNLILTQREPSGLEMLDTKITGMRITLADGTIFEETITNVKSDREVAEVDGGKIQDIPTIANVDNKLIKTIDTELMHGAKVELEYTMTVKNNSPYAFTEFSIINYASAGLTMDPNAKLLSDNYYNKDYGWNNVSITELENTESVDASKLRSMNNIYYPVATINKNTNAIRDNESLGSNGERYIKIVFQSIINSDADDWNYENDAEIFNYSNTEGRRMGEVLQNNNANVIGETFYIKPANGDEFDYANKIKIIIMPPTGFWSNYSTIVITLLVILALLVLVVGIRLYKKFHRKK